ncbi:MAG: hypothetical protein ABI425_03845 [Patescibacteria group bacterium]
MIENVTPDNFALEKEELESLRLEAQSISPEEKKEFDAIVKESYDRFLLKFGKYLDRTIETTVIEDRFILTDAQTNEEFQNMWNVDPSKRVHKYADAIGIFRAFNSDGAFVLGVPQDVWPRLSDDNRMTIIAQTGNEDNAKKFVKKAYHRNIILHEITHLYQPGGEKANSIPLWLHELQAYWVGRELCDEDSQVHNDEYDKRADFFQMLLDKYGDDVHALCLSKNKGHNEFTMYQIRKEFTLEVQQDLFPDYKIVGSTQE